MSSPNRTASALFNITCCFQQYTLLCFGVGRVLIGTVSNDQTPRPAAPTAQPPTDVVAVAGRLAPILAALSDPNRLAILLAITQRPRSVKALTDAVGLPQTLVSHHLKALREVGLVNVTAQGRSNIYTMCCDALAEPARMLATLAAGDTPTTATR
jgi:DNA-binding transcriptional ArsR family regulator